MSLRQAQCLLLVTTAPPSPSEHSRSMNLQSEINKQQKSDESPSVEKGGDISQGFHFRRSPQISQQLHNPA